MMKQDFIAGFTTIELMMVIAISGILLTLGVFQSQNWRQREQFREVQREVVSSLNQARSLTRRASTDQAINWHSGQVTTISVSGEDTDLPHEAKLEVIAPSGLAGFSYLAPFGRKSVTETITMLLESSQGELSKIYVYGASGKIAVTNCKDGNINTC